MDINISANTLFHFTKSRNSLLSILSNGLYVRYSLENYESLISGKAEIVFPMTCFCDIPLSQVKRHTNTYGNYAIGLTKNWGMKNEINPVIYSYPNSTTANIINKLTDDLENFFNIKEGEWRTAKNIDTISKRDINEINKEAIYEEKVMELHATLSHFVKYIKPYEGRFYRDGKYLDKHIKFYEEREWRFMPPNKLFEEIHIKDSYSNEYYKDPIKRRAINIKLAKHIKLNFNSNDIRFIIVNKEKEIPEILKDIENIFADKISHNQLKLLGTRLISLEQILEDL